MDKHGGGVGNYRVTIIYRYTHGIVSVIIYSHTTRFVGVKMELPGGFKLIIIISRSDIIQRVKCINL